MSNHNKTQERIAKLEKHSHQSEHVYRFILHILERFIAGISILVLGAGVGVTRYVRCGLFHIPRGSEPLR